MSFQIIAHRGSAGNRPEESSFGYTTAFGASDWVECDVQVTRDKIAICLHSIDLASVTTINGMEQFADRRRDTFAVSNTSTTLTDAFLVPDFDWRELTSLRLIRDVHDSRSKDLNNVFPLMRLSEFLTLVDALKRESNDTRNAGVYVESKTPNLYRTEFDTDVETLIVQDLVAAGWGLSPRKPVLLQSFEAESLRLMADQVATIENCEMKTVLLLEREKSELRAESELNAKMAPAFAFVDGFGLDKRFFGANKTLARSIVDLAHDKQKFLHVWTLRLPPRFWNATFRSFEDEADFFFASGVDGAFADSPNTLRSLLDHFVPDASSGAFVAQAGNVRARDLGRTSEYVLVTSMLITLIAFVCMWGRRCERKKSNKKY